MVILDAAVGTPAFNRAGQNSQNEFTDLMAGQPENIDRDMGEKFDVLLLSL